MLRNERLLCLKLIDNSCPSATCFRTRSPACRTHEIHAASAKESANGSLAFAATTQGTPRTWTYTYTPTFGRVLTIDGPRTDVVDVTTYAYYADNDGCAGCRGQVRAVSIVDGPLIKIGEG